MGTAAAANSGPTRLGKYEILHQLGAGGMGAVYRAIDTETGREVALKVLPAEFANQPNKLERFRREGKHGARLRHENIVALYEFGQSQGTYYLAMEYVDGTDLERWVKRHGPMSPGAAIDVLTQLARALEHAHALGMVHRDVKPANVLLARVMGRTVTKLADLGLARSTIEEESRVTSDGNTVGTLDYMPPEQARDSGAADIRSDLYALGCTLYHMLSGAPPFAQGSLTERLIKHAKAEPPDLRGSVPDLSDGLWAICLKLLAKRPAERYQTPAELLAALAALPEAATEGGPQLEPEPPVQEAAPPPPPRRTRARVAPTAPAPAPTEAPSSPEQRIARGQYQHAVQALAAGHCDYAISFLLNSVRLEPSNVTYWQALRQAQLQRAAAGGGSAWRRLIGTWTCRVCLHAVQRLGRPRWVLRWGARLLTHAPDDAEGQRALVAAAEELNLAATGVWLVEQLLASAPAEVDLQCALARLLERAGDARRAFALWERICEAHPVHDEARRNFQRLAVRKLTGVKGKK